MRALQEIAALDRGTVALRRDRVPITETVRSLVPNVSAEADTKGLTLVVDINPLVPAIVGDRVRLQEALKTRRSPRGWLLETGAPRVPRSS